MAGSAGNSGNPRRSHRKPRGGSGEQLSWWSRIVGDSGLAAVIYGVGGLIVATFGLLYAIHGWPFRGTPASAGAGTVTSVPPSPARQATVTSAPHSRVVKLTAGPSCESSDQSSFETRGQWLSLNGFPSGKCGEVLIHQAVGTSDEPAANWYFYPGIGANCSFTLKIPESSDITENNATYQAYDTKPGKHKSEDRLDVNQVEDFEGKQENAASSGIPITISSGPTKTGLVDLQLIDDNPDYKYEVAGMVTATCVISE